MCREVHCGKIIKAETSPILRRPKSNYCKVQWEKESQERFPYLHLSWEETFELANFAASAAFSLEQGKENISIFMVRVEKKVVISHHQLWDSEGEIKTVAKDSEW